VPGGRRRHLWYAAMTAGLPLERSGLRRLPILDRSASGELIALREVGMATHSSP
jgi:hypothetical protein